jgi:hypothetical protein
MMREALATAASVMLAAFTIGAALLWHLLTYAFLPAPF